MNNNQTERVSRKVRKCIRLYCITLVQAFAYTVFVLAVPCSVEAQSLGLEDLLSSTGVASGGILADSDEFAFVSNHLNYQSHRGIIDSEVKQKMAKVHVPFIANQGQTNKKVKFYAHTFGGTIFVTKRGELVYSLPKTEDKKLVNGIVLKEEFIGGTVKDVKGEGKAITKVSYFKGNDPSKWKRDISTYDLVSLGEVYQGVELKLKAYGNNAEKLFYVKAGMNPEIIRLKLSGGKGLEVNENGELQVKTELGGVKFTKPVAYQEERGEKEFVEVSYVVRGNEYGFKVGEYDKGKELVIDPLLGSTFLGGGDEDEATSIAISGGNVYVTGITSSSDFPFPNPNPGSWDTSSNGGEDVFVSKLSGDLKSLLASTFLGGGSDDEAFSIAIDSSGNVYVAGKTSSSDFPHTTGAFQTSCTPTSPSGPCSGDAFVSKLSGDLKSLLASTFLGGSGSDGDLSVSIALSGGNVYLAGDTDSSDFPFPNPNPGSFDTSFNGGTNDIFVSKLSGDLKNLLASTYLGGSEIDLNLSASIAIDSSGNVYVAGDTNSSDFPFPNPNPGSFDTSFNGVHDIFVSKLSGDLKNLLASTFLGGDGSDQLGSTRSIAISGGNVYVIGSTLSDDFPHTSGAFDESPNGSFDVFVSKLSGDLKNLLASTFLGGSVDDEAGSIAIDSSGNVYVAGTTTSGFSGPGQSLFPTTSGAFDTSFNGMEDVFISKLSGNLKNLLASTFLGGSEDDEGNTVAIDSGGNVYVAGSTKSSGFPTTSGAFDTKCGTDGNCNPSMAGELASDAFVSKLDSNLSFAQIVNSLVTFNPISSTFKTTSDTTGCPSGFVGKFSFSARLTDKSSSPSLSDLVVQVTTLTNGNLLQNADGGPGGVGATLTVQKTGAYSDGVLSPGEFVDVPFVICLKNKNTFSFFVNVLGKTQ